MIATDRKNPGECRKDMRRIRTGRRGEDLAAGYLETAGYRIIERNYRCLFGEMDLVARDGGTVVFIEVKSRRSNRFGPPQSSVGLKKQKKMSQIALHYLEEKQLHSCEARFDVIAVLLLPEGNRVELIKNAFDLAW
jgi:putative endonuclease